MLVVDVFKGQRNRKRSADGSNSDPNDEPKKTTAFEKLKDCSFYGPPIERKVRECPEI